jgi:hypothetical protein
MSYFPTAASITSGLSPASIRASIALSEIDGEDLAVLHKSIADDILAMVRKHPRQAAFDEATVYNSIADTVSDVMEDVSADVLRKLYAAVRS